MALYYGNKKLSKNDAKALFDMLMGSLKAIAKRYKEYADGEGQIEDDTNNYIIPAYKKELKKVERDLKKKITSEEHFSVEDIIKQTQIDIHTKMHNIAEELYEKITYYIVDRTMDGAMETKNDMGYFNGRDSDEAYQKTVESFKLADKSIAQAGELIDYNKISYKMDAVSEARLGNSSTLSADIEKLKQQAKEAEQEWTRNIYEQDIKKAIYGHRGFDKAVQYSDEMAFLLNKKDKITFSDMYEVFTGLNSRVRFGFEDGGILRSGSAEAGAIKGVSSAIAPLTMFKLLDKIAGHMNEIKNTQDPALRRTRAIQLAAFTYQTTISAHLFSDGNGRSTRLLADTILQTFGIVPHTPTKYAEKLGATFGSDIDYNKGAEVFLNGVLKSQKAIEKSLKRGVTGKEMVNWLNDKRANEIIWLQKDAKDAEGTFRDSKEYKNFKRMTDVCACVTKAIMDAKKKGSKTVNVKMNTDASKKLFGICKRKDPSLSDHMDIDRAGKFLNEAYEKMHRTAVKYMEYKMKDHTMDPKAEPKLKPLNSDDLDKLEVIKNVFTKEEYEALIHPVREAKVEVNMMKAI